MLGEPPLIGDVAPAPADLPSVAELRVLGSSRGETVLGIGVKGEGDLAVQVDNIDARTIIRIKHPPHAPADQRECGSVLFVRPDTGPDGEASGIEAKGTTATLLATLRPWRKTGRMPATTHRPGIPAGSRNGRRTRR
ncbi:MAG TPA: hypothetical protein VJ757_06805 [Pseudonocardiaceae bacterium]|nr:hypothetical protein [Pseudonocardiaceae bacterium]